MSNENTLFEAVGGRPCIARVHGIFYDKIYAHPWLSGFFVDRDQGLQERQQTDFMTRAMGGGPVYHGKAPAAAHSHMYITEEIFELRASLLRESLREAGVPDDLAERWLAIDATFKDAVVKRSVADCKGRYRTDELIVVPRPAERP